MEIDVTSQGAGSSGYVPTDAGGTDKTGGTLKGGKAEKIEQGATPGTVTDSTAPSEGQKEVPVYARPPGHPALLTPDPNLLPMPGSPDEAALAHIFDPQTLMESLKASDDAPAPGSPAAKRKEELDKEKVDDPEIVALAKQLGESPGALQEKLRTDADLAFNNLIKDLPEEDQNKLLFARQHPDAARNLRPDLKAKLDNYQEAINAFLRDNVKTPDGEPAFSTGWKGVTTDSTAFDDTMKGEFDNDFEDALQAAVDRGDITSDQAAKIKTIHYMKTSSYTPFADDTALQDLYKNVEQSAVSTLQQEYGFDTGFQPPVDSGFYTQMINGAFRQNFLAILDSTQDDKGQPLSDQDKQLIIKYYSNPNDPSLQALSTDDSNRIATLAKATKAAAISEVISQYGLESTWMPVVTTIVSSTIDTPYYKVAQDAYNTGNEIYTKAKAMVDGMPDGPMKNMYMDYLKTIGVALNKLQQYLASLAGQDAAMSSKLSMAKTDTALADIARQQKQIEDAKAAGHVKTINLGPLSHINGWMGKIVNLAISYAIAAVVAGQPPPGSGIYLAALIVASSTFYFVDSAVAEGRGQPSFIQDGFKELNDIIPGGAGWALTGPLCCLLSAGNPLMCTSLMSQDAHVIQGFLATCGADQAGQEIGAAVFDGVAQIASTIVMMLATGGAAAPEAVAEVMDTVLIAGKTYTALGTTWDTTVTVSTVCKAVGLAVQLTTGALEATSQAYQAKYEFAQAEVAKLMAQSEATTEATQALIATLKKLIDKLLQMMSGYSDWMLDISKLQDSKYTDVSSLASEISSGT